MTRHRKPLDIATREALEILEAPLTTIYNTEGHIAYYDEDGHTSVNVWHCPILRKDGCTELHTHQFHSCSTILEGVLVNELFDEGDGEPLELVTMMPGQWQALGTVHTRVTRVESTYTRGDSYCIPYDKLHRAVSPALAITLFRRSEVHRTVPIKMQVGGRLGTGGITWSPGTALADVLVRLRLASHALLSGKPTELVPLLREAAAAADPSLP